MAKPVVILAGQSNAARVSSEVVAALNVQYGVGNYILVRAYDAGAPLTYSRGQKPDWDSSDELPQNLLQDTMDALADNPGSYLAGTIWLQGEADTYSFAPAQNYHPDFLTLFAGFHQQLVGKFGPDRVGVEKSRVTVLNLSENAPAAPERANWTEIRTTLTGLDESCSWVDTLDPDAIAASLRLDPESMFSDGLHYSDLFSEYLANDLVAALANPEIQTLVLHRGTDEGDVFRPSIGADDIDGGPGRDTISFRDSSAGVKADLRSGGTAGDARGDIYVSIENIDGSGFHDKLLGNGAANIIRGNPGDDDIFGRGGNDRLIGDPGNDVLKGGAGDDFVRGGQGADTLIGGAGRDDLRGGSGDDKLRGKTGDDMLRGGAGDDLLSGAKGADILIGGPGNDLLLGGRGADNLRGADGNDTIIGGIGDDTIHAGDGNDDIFGGAGQDKFHFAGSRIGTDTIHDFEDGLDRVVIHESGDFGELNVSAVGSDTHIEFGDCTIVLLGIGGSQITSDDFIFV